MKPAHNKGKKQPHKKYNWQKLKREYVSDKRITYRFLAEKYKLAERQIRKQGAKEKWRYLRAQAEQKANEKLPEKIGNKIAEINARHLKIGGFLLGQGIKAIRDKGLVPQDYKDAQMSIVHGVEIQRKSLNLDEYKPQVAVQINFGSKEIEKWAE